MPLAFTQEDFLVHNVKTSRCGRLLNVLSSCATFNFQLCLLQGGHGTGKTGKTGNLVLTFSRHGKHREFCYNTGKVFETQGKYF